jgi:hypothetical protein
MSMWLELARLGTEGQKALAADAGATCRALFFDEGTAPSDFESTHSIGLDYRTLLAMVEGMEEAEIDCGWTRSAFGEGDEGSALDFDFTYGPAFLFSPKEVAAIAEGLASEAWDPEDDFEENIARFFALAAKKGQAVVGGVN